MRYLFIILVFMLSQNVHAKFLKRHYVPNPGDIMLSLHGNAFNYDINSDVRESNDETLLFGYAKLSYHLIHGLYAGGLYQRFDFDENKKNTFGVNLTYVYKIFHIGASYLFHSNHTYKTDLVDAELEKGSGFQVDASVNFPITWNFYVGLGVNYHTLSYDEVDYEDTSITDSSISDKESYFMPMIQLSYFFGTRGQRVQENYEVVKKKKR